MFYIVQRGDSLTNIATRFGTSVSSIIAINVICNPNLIFIGQPLLIPQPGLDYPKAGDSPYYVIQSGDTYNYVQVPSTGQIGYIPRAGFNAIQLI